MARKPSYRDLFKKTVTLENTYPRWHDVNAPAFRPYGMTRSTGPGEDRYRYARDLDASKAGSFGDCDVPEFNTELKNALTKAGSAEVIRAGKFSREIFKKVYQDINVEIGEEQQMYKTCCACRLLMVSFELTVVHDPVPRPDFNEWKRLLRGTLSMKQRSRFPLHIKQRIEYEFRPSVIFAKYDVVAMVAEAGVLEVKRCDFDEAFVFAKADNGLGYRLTKEYLLKRYELALARSVQPVPDRVPIDALGQVVDECHAVSVG